MSNHSNTVNYTASLDSASKGALPKEDTSWNPYVLDWKPFLNIEKKTWIIGESEFPVIENISDEQMKIINDLYAIPDKVETGEIG